jgi:hypothetical protein
MLITATLSIYVTTMHVDRKRPAATLPFHQNDEREIIFLTACTKAKKPILASPEIHELLTLTWQKARAWLVGYYLLMPDHLHLFCTELLLLSAILDFLLEIGNSASYVGLNPVRAGLVRRLKIGLIKVT